MRRLKCSLKLHVKLHQRWGAMMDSEHHKSVRNQGVALISLRPWEESNFRPAV
jgi:hypothetical protein